MLTNEFSPPMHFDFPPMKQSEYIEKYFMKYIKEKKITLNRKYINVCWATLYYDKQFMGIPFDEYKLQKELDNLPQNDRYFTISQYSSLFRHRVPPDTMSIGNSFGTVPMPLLYENNKIFNNVPFRSWEDKKIFCSFFGGTAGPVRERVKIYADKFNDYIYSISPGNPSNTESYIENIHDTKFCLAPRGFGRSSYRFFEITLLGSIPIYIWDDKNWLPFRNKIDYSKFSIVLNISELENLDPILRSITKEKYEEMRSYAKSISHMYKFEGACKQFIKIINKTVHISGNSGLGDQLMGYACSEVLSHELGARTMLNMNIFDSENCPISVKSMYKSNRDTTNSMNIEISCQPGRDMMKRKFVDRIFWEQIHESDNIYIKNHTYVLDTLINNQTGAVSFTNKQEILNQMHKALRRLFNRYCTVNYNGLVGYNLLRHHNVISFHLRTGDDIFMLNNIRKDKWPSHIVQKLTNICSGIGQHLIENPVNFRSKFVIFSDLHPDDIHEFIRKFIPKHIKFFRYNVVKSIHSDRQQPDKKQWNKILDDFMILAHSKRCYVTPNSNFSRTALLYNKNPLSSSFFVDSLGKVSPVSENVTTKPGNYI